jgi:hypothetical protein
MKYNSAFRTCSTSVVDLRNTAFFLRRVVSPTLVYRGFQAVSCVCHDILEYITSQKFKDSHYYLETGAASGFRHLVLRRAVFVAIDKPGKFYLRGFPEGAR